MQRWLKRALFGFWSVVLLVLAVVATWVVSNGPWADEAPAPLPAALRTRPVTLAPERNAFFNQVGLRAPSGESANAFGQRAWRGETPEIVVGRLDMPQSALWNCRPAEEDCMQRWRAAAKDVRAEMDGAAEYGRRCEALLEVEGYQEPVFELRGKEALSERDYLTPPFAPAGGCLRWFQLRAVLAPDVAAARADWARADALLRRVAGGAQTLISHVITWSWARNQALLLAQWLAREPVAELELAWLEPLPASILQPRTWMVGEAHFQRQTTTGLIASGTRMFDDPNALQAWANRMSLGYLPNATQRRMDEDWLRRIDAVGDLQGAELARQAAALPEQADTSVWALLRWRNTVGNMLVDVSTPAFQGYFLRQADLVLYQQALRLVAGLNLLAPTERAAWLARQPAAPELLTRMRVEGDALVVSGWQAEADTAQVKPLRFVLRPA